jgi:K+-sensing histidine kinase KdpD
MPSNSDNSSGFSFSTLLASSVHDMKNILGSVLESIDWLSSKMTLDEDEGKEFKKMGHLLAHVNSELMQLLCLYKFENDQYSLLLNEHYVEEFLEMQLAFLTPLIKGDSCEITINCDEDLVWYFDEMLLSTAIRNAAMNSLKFAKSKINLSAKIVDNCLCFQVEDDGSGFPESMLGKVEDGASKVDFSTGSTGLGLYFSQMAAKLHEVKGCKGYVELTNNQSLPGACLTLIVP